MNTMEQRGEFCGIADMMRWEILAQIGGFAVDADSVCVRPLDDWLFEPDVFACWENELMRPGLISNGYVYAVPENILINQVVEDIHRLPTVKEGSPWKLTGPQRLTDTFQYLKYAGLTIYPSHYFLPIHLTGAKYAGVGQVFAHQLWGSTEAGRYLEIRELMKQT